MPISLCMKQGFVFLVLTLPHLVGVQLIFKNCYEAKNKEKLFLLVLSQVLTTREINEKINSRSVF